VTTTVTTAHPGVQLEPIELLACWEALDLGEPPFLLRLRRPAGTREQRAATHRRLGTALAGLVERGLATTWPSGIRPTPPLAGLLILLAGAEYQLDIRFTGPGGRPTLGLGAVRGADGVVLVGADGLGPTRAFGVDGCRVEATLLELLGPVEPGVGVPVNIPGGVFDAACAAARDGNSWTLADELVACGVTRHDAASLARMSTGVDFGGQLGVTGRVGRERRGPWVVGFLRCAGKYVVQVRRDDTVTMGPTDAGRLLRHWRELVDQL
jgi:hypothetical protein